MGRHDDDNGDGIADFAQMQALQPSDDEIAAATAATGYVFTDPVDDAAHPRIAAGDPVSPPDVFPENWAAGPTERDQAAIDAGNA